MKRLCIAIFSILMLACFAASMPFFNGSSRHYGPIGAPSAAQLRMLLSQAPVPGKITSLFGMRVHPIFHRRILHQGMDFRAPMGTPVANVLDGVVVRVATSGGFGNAVYIYHPTARKVSMYAHLSKIGVVLGQFVKQGNIIGLSGASGYATGAHLHFGVKDTAGNWVDPLLFLRQGPHYQALALGQRDAVNSQVSIAMAVGRQIALPPALRNKPLATTIIALDKAQPTSKSAVSPAVASASPSALNDSINSPDRILAGMAAAMQRTSLMGSFVAHDSAR